MSALKDLKLFATHPHPCSYLEGRWAKTLFIDPEIHISTSQHSRLSEIGFRRSGGHLYRPFCDGCQACIPCRVVVEDFRPGRRFRRVMARNRDIHVERRETLTEDGFYSLYERYINERHSDGDMYPASREQFSSFLGTTCDSTAYYVMRDDSGRLLGVMVSDQLDHALSAVYTFFDPEAHRRSLGTFAVLWQIEEARRLGLPYLYLGYWIRDCQKMAYKTAYRPLQVYLNGQWSRLN